MLFRSVPNLYTLANSLRPAKQASIALENLFLSAYYSFDFGISKYLSLNATGRLEKTSTLPLDNNSYFYPSFGIATAVSDYVKLPTAISFLKFRGSYAEGRNAGIFASIGQPAIGVGSGQSYGTKHDFDFADHQDLTGS